MRKMPMLVLVLLGLAGCSSGTVLDEASFTRPPPPETTTTSAAASTSTTAPAPTTSTTRRATTTTRPPTTSRATTTLAPATTPPLGRAEATSKLCAQLKSADDAVQDGRFVAGGLRLSSGIGSYGTTADPAVVDGARRMLRTGLDGDVDGYVVARRAAADACARAGAPIVLRGQVQCVTTPCP